MFCSFSVNCNSCERIIKKREKRSTIYTKYNSNNILKAVHLNAKINHRGFVFLESEALKQDQL